MRRFRHEVEAALALRNSGLSPSSIGRCLNIPRSTVREWLSGRVPKRLDERVSVHCPRCLWPPHDFDALPPEFAYLLGLYLGDGCISPHHRGVFKLRITLDAAYPGIIEEAVSATRAVMSRNAVNRQRRPDNCVEVTSHSRTWPCLFPQHGPGKKHLRRIVLADWQERLVARDPHLLLRGLIHSDGCRFMNTGKNWSYPRYVFTNHSDDIRSIFTTACDLIGIRWTVAPRRIYVSRKADVDRMDTFIGPKR